MDHVLHGPCPSLTTSFNLSALRSRPRDRVVLRKFSLPMRARSVHITATILAVLFSALGCVAPLFGTGSMAGASMSVAAHSNPSCCGDTCQCGEICPCVASPAESPEQPISEAPAGERQSTRLSFSIVSCALHELLSDAKPSLRVEPESDTELTCAPSGRALLAQVSRLNT